MGETTKVDTSPLLSTSTRTAFFEVILLAAYNRFLLVFLLEVRGSVQIQESALPLVRGISFQIEEKQAPLIRRGVRTCRIFLKILHILSFVKNNLCCTDLKIANLWGKSNCNCISCHI